MIVLCEFVFFAISLSLSFVAAVIASFLDNEQISNE